MQYKKLSPEEEKIIIHRAALKHHSRERLTRILRRGYTRVSSAGASFIAQRKNSTQDVDGQVLMMKFLVQLPESQIRMESVLKLYAHSVAVT